MYQGPRPPRANRPRPDGDKRAPQSFVAKPLELAVIIPTLNEAGNIAPLLAALDRTLLGKRWEAVFVDDGSTDGTVEAVEQIARHRRDVRLIRRVGRRGLSSAVVEGMLATVAPVVAVIDGDMQHDEALLPELVAAVAEDRADVAIGTRYADGGSIGDWNRRRHRLSTIGTRLAALIVGRTVSDPMSGFFAARRALVVEAAPRLSNVGFKLLVDLLASARGPVRIAELPYHFRSRQTGDSKLDAMVSIEFALLLADKLIGHVVPPRLLMFLAVGGLGLLVNLLMLGISLRIGLGFVTAQIVAVGVAIVSNFTLNNIFTYRDRRLSGLAWWRGLASFALVCLTGAAAQVSIANLVYGTHHSWWVAGIAGAVLGAVWNYAASSFLTWKLR
jgi:dolichol-phosphate mannosyltransferase